MRLSHVPYLLNELNKLTSNKNPTRNEGILGAISGSGSLRTGDLEGLHLFEKVVAGQGSNSAEYDMNVNFTLGSAREFRFATLSILPRLAETRVRTATTRASPTSCLR